jgi:hypothetical protein
MSTGDRLSFSTFLDTRIRLGIEEIKSRQLIDFITLVENEKTSKEAAVTEDTKVPVEIADTIVEDVPIAIRKTPGRPRKEPAADE